MNFFKEYLKNPRSIGAIAPSSKSLIQKITSTIDYNTCNCIVEYGPGTGVFTQNIIKHKKEETKFFVFETNYIFYNMLFNKYRYYKNVFIIYDSAENASLYLKKNNIDYADYIISGLPFTSLPQEVNSNILKETKKIMSNKSQFCLFQYTLLQKKKLSFHFKLIKQIFVLKNLPPAFVFVFKKF